MANKIGPDHYRYYASLDEEGVHVRCEKFVVIGETEHCYYVIRDSMRHLAGIDWRNANPWQKKLRKRVLKRSYRRYCYPDKQEALRSFKARQRWRLAHAARSVAIAELALNAVAPVLEHGEQPKDYYIAGQNDYTSSLVWDC